MKFPAFDYVGAAAEEHALAVLRDHGNEAHVLAGGQSLLPLLAMRLSTPAILVDINRIRELGEIRVVGGDLQIGALVRHREVLSSSVVAGQAPLLAAAARHVAHPGVRNRGTFGGSIALSDPASEFPACAVALDSTIVARSSTGERKIPAGDFFRGLYETALQPDELLIRVDVPAPAAGELHAFVACGRRNGDYAMAGLAARAAHKNGKLSHVTLCFFAVSDRPVLVPRAAAILREHGFREQALVAAIDAAREEIEFQEGRAASAALRRHLVGTLLRQAVTVMERSMPSLEVDHG